MPKRRKSRIYWRTRGALRRAYADFRDLGGKQEALIPDGELSATTDPDVAELLCARRVKVLEEAQRYKAVTGLKRRVSLEDFAADHLVMKAKTGEVTQDWISMGELFLRRAVAHFGADRDLVSIRVSDVKAWLAVLRETKGKHGRPLSGGSIRHHLNALSNLYRSAQEAEIVPPGFNPVAALQRKPTAERKEAKWLEVPDASLLLESARTYREPPSAHGYGFGYQLLATLLLTGGRWSEVAGLTLEDVSLDRETVTFRPNEWRRLKTATSWRTITLWPQLAEILGPYLSRRTAREVLEDEPSRSLLFAATGRQGREHLMQDCRKYLDAIAGRAGWKAGEIRSKMFRHSYCAARLQTTDHGAPVSPFTVAREMGHGGDSLVRRIYGHLGNVRHRSEVVEYRIEQHREVLEERIAALQLSS